MSKQISITSKGKTIYYKILPILKKKYKTGFVTIETDSEEFFVGTTPIEAINKAKKQFPRKQFFMAQIGKMSGLLK
ncbi:hypothetical protein KKE45_02070 [Patescibacteria group bacterium]|nr:hypothetical protein [Patescibacteria group bacterium]